MANSRRENQQGKVNTRRKTGDDFGQKRVKTRPINRPEEGGQKRVVRPPKNKKKSES